MTRRAAQFFLKVWASNRQAYAQVIESSSGRVVASASLARSSIVDRRSSLLPWGPAATSHMGQSNHMGVPSMQKPSLGLRTAGSLMDSRSGAIDSKQV